MMTNIILLIAGLFIGGVAVWFIVSTRFKFSHSKEMADLKMDFSKQTTEIEGKARALRP